MLIVVSPAKTLDFDSPLRTRKATEPEYLAQSASLVKLMRTLEPADLQAMMAISEPLAELNHARFRQWSKNHTAANSRQALYAFMGDVYTGLDAHTLDSADVAYAQKRLRILSGLYGLLRPLDRIQPYRLEMGSALATPRGVGLYRYWGEQIARALNEQAHALRTRYLVNLASQEYFKAIDTAVLEAEIVTPVFKERKGDDYRIVSFFAKKARGMMARYIIQTRARRPAALRDFDLAGYRYNEALSHAREYVFTRETA